MSTYTNLLFHIIYSTKFRKPSIDSKWENDLYGYVGGILRDNRGVLLKAGGVEDHVHLLAKLPPTIAGSDMLRLMKANSSKWINEVKQPNRPFEWQPGYAAFSVSESQVVPIEAYISRQKEHHKATSFEEEFLLFFEKHNIAFDRRYVFENDKIHGRGRWACAHDGHVAALRSMGSRPMATTCRPIRD